MSRPLSSTTPGPVTDEDLVAYLDQEADPDRARLIETRLLTDDGLRDQIAELERPFDLLDLLPRTEAGESFTRTTITRITVAQARHNQARSWRRALGAVGGTAAAILLVALLGGTAFLVARYRADEPNRRLLADLPVLRDFDALREAGDLAWLMTLREAAIFPDRPGTTDIPPASTTRPSGPTSPGPEARPADGAPVGAAQPAKSDRASVPGPLLDLPPEDARRIVRNVDRLAALPPAEQASLRTLAAAIAAEPDAERLRQVARQYLDFMSHRDAAVRAELRGLPPTDRIARIRDLRRRDLIDDLVATTRLDKPESRALLNWMAAYQDRHMADYAKVVGGAIGHPPRGGGNAPLPWPVRAMLFWRYERAHGTPMPDPGAAELATLEASLSPALRQKLGQVPSTREKVRVIWGWSRQAGVEHLTPGREELEAFREQLPEAEKQELDGLPPEEFQRQLQAKYLRRFGGPSPMVGPSYDGRPGRGGPRPPGFDGPPDRPPADAPFGGGGPPPGFLDRPPFSGERGPDRSSRDGRGQGVPRDRVSPSAPPAPGMKPRSG